MGILNLFKPEETNGKALPYWEEIKSQDIRSQASSQVSVDAASASEKSIPDRLKDALSNPLPVKVDVQFFKKHLSELEFDLLRNNKTEKKHSSELNNHFPKKGYYACRACGNPVYNFFSKFHSGCGWPAFESFVEGAIQTEEDLSHGLKRTELRCSRCSSHLGHVFKENRGGFRTERHCVNGRALKYVKRNLSEKTNGKCKVFQK